MAVKRRGLIFRIRRWHYRRLREIDANTIFPAIREAAGSEEVAELAIELHKQLDPIWDSEWD